MQVLARMTPATASARPTEPRSAVPDAGRSRRSVMLGMGASLLGLASTVGKATAAAPRLADLVLPLVKDMDANGDGRLDVDEVRGAIQRSGGPQIPRARVVRDVMAPVDFNDDAVLTVDEFARGMALELDVDERWMDAMGARGGRVSREELAAGLGDLGPRGEATLPVAFEMADANKDGRLDASEARTAMLLMATGVLGDYYEGDGGF
ncbi:hypothetical protein HYH03_010006 [Edaphochlamys debaryana]|uniref:EF-hand domain-containing protein n=1 Tax=Edaphochlamys debaryana TaxID=47281 RepID=A0A836BWL8_9CHLO|nr:hypothetical protein HYH03_010006 [Edaphochlamys debaryana]|eukprot:KAG2491635.1 hypothetical protein HYH03_010006 [Edaphochlamys debaryana]